MTRRRILFLLALAAAGFVAAARATDARIVDGVVAVVNGEPVTYSEFRESVAEMLRIPEGDADLYLREERNRSRILQGIETLVESVLVRQRLVALGQEVSDKEVEQAVRSVQRDNRMSEEEFRAALEREGITPQAFRRRIRWQMERGAIVRALRMKAVTVTEEEVRRYYAENEERFRKGGEVRVEILHLPVPAAGDGDEAVGPRIAARRAADAIRAGLTLAEAVRLVAPTVPGASVMEPGFLKTEELAPEIGREVERLRTGEVSSPVFTAEGGFIVRVLERRGGTAPPFEELRERLTEELVDRRSEQSYAEILTELKREATIDIRL
ncbi:MAG: peptidyl-prolyl cis-trans isomerase [Deltaproteobacteria bacterium]